MPRARFRAIVGCLALAAGLWAIIGSAWLLPQLSANSDEGIYLLQADTILDGRLSPVAPAEDAEAFVPWFSHIGDDHYDLKYTPVHASFIAVTSLGMALPRLALGLLAAAQVVTITLLARELGLARTTTLIGVGLFAASPVILQLSITYLPYSTSLLLATSVATCGLRGVRAGSRGWIMLAGLAWGLLVFSRPFDGILWLLIITIGVARTHSWAAVRRSVADFVIGAILPLVTMLATNEATTGDAFQLPFNQLEPLDRLGFGERRSVPTDPLLDYGPGEALSALGRNLLLVGGWTGGGAVTIALGLWALARRAVSGRAFIVATIVIWPLGYAYFWGSYVSVFVWDGGLFLGPYYYVPVVLAFCLAGAVGLVAMLEHHPTAGRIAIAGGIVLSAVLAVPTLAEQHDRSSQRAQVAEVIADEVIAPALVFIPPVYGPYLQNPFSFLRNSPTLDGDVVYALEGGEGRDEAIRSRYPDRTAYRLVLENGWTDQPGFDPDVRIERLGGQ